MEREMAVKKLKELEGQDLRPLADKYGVTVWKEWEAEQGLGWSSFGTVSWIAYQFFTFTEFWFMGTQARFFETVEVRRDQSQRDPPNHDD